MAVRQSASLELMATFQRPSWGMLAFTVAAAPSTDAATSAPKITRKPALLVALMISPMCLPQMPRLSRCGFVLRSEATKVKFSRGGALAASGEALCEGTHTAGAVARMERSAMRERPMDAAN